MDHDPAREGRTVFCGESAIIRKKRRYIVNVINRRFSFLFFPPLSPGQFLGLFRMRFTEQQKKTIIAERLQGESLRKLGAKYGVSSTTIMKITNKDGAFKKAAEKKTREIEESILKHMEAQKPRVNMLLDQLLDEMGNKDKQAAATLVQLATTMGILIDKFTSFEQSQAAQSSSEDDPITKAIKESVKNAKR